MNLDFEQIKEEKKTSLQHDDAGLDNRDAINELPFLTKMLQSNFIATRLDLQALVEVR